MATVKQQSELLLKMHTLYKSIREFVPEEFTGHKKIENAPYMNLAVEVFFKKRFHDKPYTVLSISHYYEQNWDIMYDPDIEFALFDKQEIAYPLTYRQDSLWLHHETCIIVDGDVKCANRLQFIELVRFSTKWMKNLKAQGFLSLATK